MPKSGGSSRAMKEERHMMSQDKMHKVMSEYKHGSLKSSSGKKVTNRKQAIAIAMSEVGMSKRK